MNLFIFMFLIYSLRNAHYVLILTLFRPQIKKHPFQTVYVDGVFEKHSDGGDCSAE